MDYRDDLKTKEPIKILANRKYETCGICLHRLNGQEDKRLNSRCVQFGQKVKAGAPACEYYENDGIPF